ncbi:MAG TPA: iron-containing alcohol dehydrogenase [Rickettsiales bacterium]|nr:iron-containing alcohol dehydrogenase [Rickettsiales bacterium]
MINRLKELLPAKILNDNCYIAIELSLADQASELISHAGLSGKKLLAVCDPATHEALGKEIVRQLGCDMLMLPAKPHADDTNVALVRARKAEGLLAIGSGTINDICKYASYLDGIPYAVFPTAPSMNGYLSANASITVDGHKQTLKAHLPQGVFCDLSVLLHAPHRLIRSGLGDSLCRPTAQADWLLSHLLFDTPYNALPFELLAPYEQELFTHADKLTKADPAVMALLIKNLLVSGAGMTLAGGSYPASQGEHLIAHTMEMKYGAALPETYHGEQIGVTTLIMAGIQQQMLANGLKLTPPVNPEKAIEEYFGPALSVNIGEAYGPKAALYKQYEAINERLRTEGSAITDALQAVMVPQRTLREVLQKANAPTSASDIGWNKAALEQAVLHARFIRNRFTFLDVLSL